MENISPDFPRYGKLFSTVWKIGFGMLGNPESCEGPYPRAWKMFNPESREGTAVSHRDAETRRIEWERAAKTVKESP